MFKKNQQVLEFIRMRDFAAAIDYVSQLDELDKLVMVKDIDA
jgi:hypothetical protein